MKVLVAQSCLTLCDPMEYSPPDSSSTGFSRQEYWSRLPRSPLGALPNPGIEPRSPALQVESLPAEPKKVGNHCPNGHNSENYTSSPDCSLSF